MYWEFEGTKQKVLTVPFYELGTNFDIKATLITESGDTLTNVYLCVAKGSHAGYVSAKRGNGSTYLTLGGLFNSNCFIGDISANDRTNIDFRINVSSYSEGEILPIQVVVGHDDGVPMPNASFENAVDLALWYDVDAIEIFSDVEDL